MTTLDLAFDVTFEDLYSSSGIKRIDGIFLDWFGARAPDLCFLLRRGREDPVSLTGPAYRDFLVQSAPYVAKFIEELFRLDTSTSDQTYKTVADFRRLVVQKRVAPPLKAGILTPCFDKNLDGLGDEALATYVMGILEDVESPGLNDALAYCAWRLERARKEHLKDPLFNVPLPQDFDDLLDVKQTTKGLEALHLRPRDGFALTTTPMTPMQAGLESHYCLHCHTREKDACSRGLKNSVTDGVQTNPLGTVLSGCPLGQKISEMALLKSQGQTLAAMIVAALDNPLMVATGERICQDCAQSCVFQKQTPVDVPALESQIFTQILEGAWGFEIYGLLTRWSALSLTRAWPQESTGYSVLVVGMGPAGFTMAHHLLNQGHHVVGMEGLKITPLDASLSGVDAQGARVPMVPIQDVKAQLYEPLESRSVGGFGGVAEYGITARWDKNRLKIIRLLLERRIGFSLVGSTRWGSQIEAFNAFEMGFDHIALCLGAGAPNLINIPGGLVPGVRYASDFLMTLHMGGAFKHDSLTSLEVSLPAYVVGGGLTAVDTATEVLAYYPVQVTRFYERYTDLCLRLGEEATRKLWSADQWHKVDTFVRHGREIIQERERAQKEGRAPDFLPLLNAWGGVHILYRRALKEAPAYRLNAHELQKALEEGVILHPHTRLEEVLAKGRGFVSHIRVIDTAGEKALEAGSVFLATGVMTCDQERSQDSRITCYGDMDPNFSGSVVKAMASATQGSGRIGARLLKNPPRFLGEEIADKMRRTMRVRLLKKNILAPGILELILHAPSAAYAFKPGQFFRLQSLSSQVPMEALALTGAGVDLERGTLSVIILDSGVSSKSAWLFKEGDELSLMGPTGAPTDLPENKKALLVGGGLGNAVLFSIARALKERGCTVLYCAGYKNPSSLFKREEIEEAACQVYWSTQSGGLIKTARPGDFSLSGTVVDLLKQIRHNPSATVLKGAPDFLLTIGSASMMEAVQKVTRDPFYDDTQQMAGINTPMHCMMKGICGTCVQAGRDERTGKAYMFLACVNQDHPLHRIDFGVLKGRLRQNEVQEVLNYYWMNGQEQYFCHRS